MRLFLPLLTGTSGEGREGGRRRGLAGDEEVDLWNERGREGGREGEGGRKREGGREGRKREGGGRE